MSTTAMQTKSRKRERCEDEPEPVAKKQVLGRGKCQLNSNITLHRIDADTYNSRLSNYVQRPNYSAGDFARLGVFCVRKDIAGLVDPSKVSETVCSKYLHTIVVDCEN